MFGDYHVEDYSELIYLFFDLDLDDFENFIWRLASL